MKILIVGAGLSGLTLLEKLDSKGHQVSLIEKRSQIGGNVSDSNLESILNKIHNLDSSKKIQEILIHQYGAHIFHTSDKQVWDYVNRFSLFYPYQHQVLGLVNGEFVPIPFNLNSLRKLFPKKMAKEIESALIKEFGFGTRISILELQKFQNFNFIADFIYEKVFKNYTQKQWGASANVLDSSVLARVPIVISKDNRYFPNDTFQGIPLNGYSKMCKAMLDSAKNADVRFGVDFKSLDKNFIDDFELIFYSGGIDEFFDYRFGELPYRSLEFKHIYLDREFFSKNAVLNYPNDYDFTRIIEHKHFLNQQAKHTIITYEYPKDYIKGKTQAYYPIPSKDSQDLYKKYAEFAKANAPKLRFIGRLGEYKYYDMDKAIKRALEIANEF